MRKPKWPTDFGKDVQQIKIILHTGLSKVKQSTKTNCWQNINFFYTQGTINWKYHCVEHFGRIQVEDSYPLGSVILLKYLHHQPTLAQRPIPATPVLGNKFY